MQVESKAFFKAVDYVSKAAARGLNGSILSGIRIQASPGEIGIRATDLQVTLETTVSAEGNDTWQVVVDPKGLKPVKALADADRALELVVRQEQHAQHPNLVVATGPDEETVLVGMDAKDFPEPAGLPHLYGLGEIGRWELGLLPHLLAHAAESDQRPVLSGVYLDANGWTATDSSRLLHVPHREGSVELDGIPGVVFPARALELLLASPYEAEKVAVRVTGQPPEDGPKSGPVLAALETGTVRVWTRLIEGNYPPYRNVFPQTDHAHQFVLEQARFAQIRKVLRAVDSMSRRGPGVVTLRFAETQVTVEAKEADVGSIRSRLPVNRYNGTLEAEGTYQARFLRDMLETFETLGEPAYVSLNGSGAGYFLAPCGVTCIIMGVRLG